MSTTTDPRDPLFRNARWERRPALVREGDGGQTRYYRQVPDAAEHTLQPDAWDHEHCMVCEAVICDHDEACREAYTTDAEEYWLCPRCYDKHFLHGRDRYLWCPGCSRVSRRKHWEKTGGSCPHCAASQQGARSWQCVRWGWSYPPDPVVGKEYPATG